MGAACTTLPPPIQRTARPAAKISCYHPASKVRHIPFRSTIAARGLAEMSERPGDVGGKKCWDECRKTKRERIFGAVGRKFACKRRFGNGCVVMDDGGKC
ncbi:hypothetical protein KM043_009636 [Ampulex compressa]|nr:hypothetical protein KM043_009636 [Ampulex compressa]